MAGKKVSATLTSFRAYSSARNCSHSVTARRWLRLPHALTGARGLFPRHRGEQNRDHCGAAHSRDRCLGRAPGHDDRCARAHTPRQRGRRHLRQRGGPSARPGANAKHRSRSRFSFASRCVRCALVSAALRCRWRSRSRTRWASRWASVSVGLVRGLRRGRDSSDSRRLIYNTKRSEAAGRAILRLG